MTFKRHNNTGTYITYQASNKVIGIKKKNNSTVDTEMDNELRRLGRNYPPILIFSLLIGYVLFGVSGVLASGIFGTQIIEVLFFLL